MLDTDVPRVRVDRLREHIEEQKSKCEKQREDALDGDDECGYYAESGKIEAYYDILFYIEQRAQRYEDYKTDSTVQDSTEKIDRRQETSRSTYGRSTDEAGK